MMHWLSFARGWDSDFEDAHEFVFEDNFVTIRRRLHCVVTIRELGFVLSAKVKMTGEQHQKARS